MTEFPTLLKEVCRYESDSDRMRHRISRTMRAPNHGFLFSRTHVRATRPCPRRARRRITFLPQYGLFFPQRLSFFRGSFLFFLQISVGAAPPTISRVSFFPHTRPRNAPVSAPTRRRISFLPQYGLFFPRQLYLFFPAISVGAAPSTIVRVSFFPHTHVRAPRPCPR